MTEPTALQPSAAGRVERPRPFGWRNRVIGLEYHRPNEILDHPHQWRVHPDKQLVVLRGVLGDIGIAGALLVYQSIRANGALVSIDGHGRKRLDPSCDWPCLMLDLTDTEADVLLSTFDPVGAMALVDCEKLNLLLAATPVKNADLAAMLKKLQAERPSTLGAPVTQDPGAQIDRAAELQAKWKTERGQIWKIGKHRLMCGDGTSAGDVAKVLAGAKPLLMVTDPPYGVEYDAGWRNDAMPEKNPRQWRDGHGRAIGKVTNDDRADWRAAWILFPGDVAYVWHGGNRANVVANSLVACGFELRSQIVWAKSQFVISRGHYHGQHEPCWYAVRSGATGHWRGDHSQTTLWSIEKPHKSETGHSTQKPIECMARPIRNHEGDVYDPFLGSGTTMVAAEQLGRVCYGMEIEPKYVAVSLERMAGMGLEPKLVEP